MQLYCEPFTVGLKKRPLEWEVKANVVQYRDKFAGLRLYSVLGSWNIHKSLVIHVSNPDRVLDDLPYIPV